MAYNENLANRLRRLLADLPSIEEKEMFGGLVFMYRDKMLCGIVKNELMCRVDPELREALLEQNGVSEMKMKTTVMKSFLLIDQAVLSNKKELMYWIKLCLVYNPKAKASKKKD